MLDSVPLLAAGDIEATAAYYQETLGFEITDLWPGRWVRLRHGEVMVEIEQSDAIRRIGPFEKGGIVLRVADVDAWCAELRQRGAKFDQGPMDQQYGRRDFSILDPNGYRLIFWQPLRTDSNAGAVGGA